MYSVPETLNNLNLNMNSLLIFGTIANILAYIQVIYGTWVGFRDKSHGVPLIAVVLFFAHDSYYVFNYDYWIHTIGHVFFIGNLVAMSIFVIFELIIMWQIITYSREEVGLGKTWGMAFFNLLAIQVGAYILTLWFKSMMGGDPLYLQLFAVSVVIANVSNIPMLLRRGTRKGQSMIIAWALFFQTGPICFYFAQPAYGPYFSQPIWLLAGAANTVLAGAYVWLLYKAPPYKRPKAA